MGVDITRVDLTGANLTRLARISQTG
jgi:hypothetical protein